MKKILVAAIIYCSTLTACEDELCYNCSKSNGSYKNFCLPREEAKQTMENLENAGYNCEKK